VGLDRGVPTGGSFGGKAGRDPPVTTWSHTQRALNRLEQSRLWSSLAKRCARGYKSSCCRRSKSCNVLAEIGIGSAKNARCAAGNSSGLWNGYTNCST